MVYLERHFSVRFELCRNKRLSKQNWRSLFSLSVLELTKRSTQLNKILVDNFTPCAVKFTAPKMSPLLFLGTRVAIASCNSSFRVSVLQFVRVYTEMTGKLQLTNPHFWTPTDPRRLGTNQLISDLEGSPEHRQADPYLHHINPQPELFCHLI